MHRVEDEDAPSRSQTEGAVRGGGDRFLDPNPKVAVQRGRGSVTAGARRATHVTASGLRRVAAGSDAQRRRHAPRRTLLVSMRRYRSSRGSTICMLRRHPVGRPGRSAYLTPRLNCTKASPWSAATRYHRTASTSSCGTPQTIGVPHPEAELRIGKPLVRRHPDTTAPLERRPVGRPYHRRRRTSARG